MFFVCTAKLSLRSVLQKTYLYELTNLSVLSVSCRNFVPGAKLQISKPTERPPSASCKRRVSLELR